VVKEIKKNKKIKIYQQNKKEKSKYKLFGISALVLVNGEH